VSHAFHSALMEPMLDEFREVARTLTFHPPQIPVISNLDGTPAGERLTDPEYWVAHVRQSVRFSEGVAALAEAGVVTCLEVGPGRALSGLGPQTTGDTITYIPTSGRREDSEARALVTAVGRAYARGTDVDWDAFYAPLQPRRVDLPTYPFQRRRYWLTLKPAGTGDATGFGQLAGGHPLAGALVPVPGEELVLTGQVSLKTHPWLADHTILGTALLPGTAWVDLALHAGAQAGCPTLRELTLHAPLPLTHDPVALHVTVEAPHEDGDRTLTIHSRTADGAWTQHAGVTVTPRTAPARGLDAWPPQGATPADLDGFYDRLAEQGVTYGPLFQGMSAAWTTPDGTVYAEVTLPERDGTGFGIHPALLDAALHGTELTGTGTDQVELPFAWTDVTLHATGATRARVRLTTADGVTSVLLADSTGAPLAEVGGLTMRPVSDAPMTAPPAAPRDGLYQVTWTATSHPAAPSGAAAVAGWLREALTAAGVTVTDDPDQRTLMYGAPPHTWSAGDTPSALHAVLDTLRTWLSDERSATTRLAVVTRRAVAARTEDPAPEPEQAAITGLVRAAQAENPGRILLVDVDGTDASYRALPAVVHGEEPGLALRDGAALAPRLAKADPPPLAADGPWRVDVREKGTIEQLTAAPIADRPL